MEYLSMLEEVNRLEKESFPQEIRIAILRNYTVENLIPYLKYRFFSRGIGMHCEVGGYNNIQQEIFNPDSLIYKGNPLIALCLTTEEFTSFEGLTSADSLVIIDELRSMIDKLLADTSSLIACSLFLLPFYPESGIAQVEEDKAALIDRINEVIFDYRRLYPARFFVIDTNRILRILGEENAIDYRYWYSAKAPFKHAFLLQQSLEIAKIGYALLGKNKKCLVLDCDNTLWKGIIGEDGINGIKLDKDSHPGNIFYNFQRSVIQLYDRGVIIVLNSKNNEDDVFEVLDNHPSCLIKRKHLSTFRINWNNKVDNLKEIAEELNIGLDYFVFVDDNPVECSFVKEQLPEVTVIQVPQKLYHYPDILLREGLFDTLTISEEDRKRNALYQVESKRREAKKQFTDITEYLRSLEIELRIGENALQDIGRLAQLTQKTNQFNLTTSRFSEEEMKAYIQRNGKVVYFGVKDKFGDMGITGLLMASQSGNEVRIDNFLLSCRILGRNIEKAFIGYCLSQFFSDPSIEVVTATYVPSKKNMQTAGFWDSMGLENTGPTEMGASYRLNRANYKEVTYDYITIKKITE